MITLKVVDFIIEQHTLEAPDFCYSVSAYYTFDHAANVDELEFHDIVYFNIMVGSSNGLGICFERLAKNSANELVFFPHTAVVQNADKKKIMELVRKKLESITGKTEKEVIRKAMREFDWEYEDDEVELKKLYS